MLSANSFLAGVSRSLVLVGLGTGSALSRVWGMNGGYGCGVLVEPLSDGGVEFWRGGPLILVSMKNVRVFSWGGWRGWWGIANDYNGVSSRVVGCEGSKEVG